MCEENGKLLFAEGHLTKMEIMYYEVRFADYHCTKCCIVRCVSVTEKTQVPFLTHRLVQLP